MPGVEPTPTEARVVQVDFVSDVVCPWCVVGYRQLIAAAEETGVTLDIRFHPFELNPNMPEEGQNLGEHLAEKYGTTPEGSRQARARLTAVGNELGFEFSFSDDSRIVSTFRAHQLMAWAGQVGRRSALKLRIFACYFSHGEDINKIDVLAKCAESIGLDGAEATKVLEDGVFAEEVRREEAVWTSRGVRAVPSMVFDEKYLAQGAQGTAQYAAMLRKLTSA